jgi:hypothetical protein
MNRDSTGTHRITSTGEEQVRAFVALPLPPVPPLDLNGPRQLLLERATLAVGRLDSISTLLPDPHLFLYSYVRREAALSSQIEGTQSSLSDLLLLSGQFRYAPVTAMRAAHRNLSPRKVEVVGILPNYVDKGLGNAAHPSNGNMAPMLRFLALGVNPSSR